MMVIINYDYEYVTETENAMAINYYIGTIMGIGYSTFRTKLGILYIFNTIAALFSKCFTF